MKVVHCIGVDSRTFWIVVLLSMGIQSRVRLSGGEHSTFGEREAHLAEFHPIVTQAMFRDETKYLSTRLSFRRGGKLKGMVCSPRQNNQHD